MTFPQVNGPFSLPCKRMSITETCQMQTRSFTNTELQKRSTCEPSHRWTHDMRRVFFAGTR